MFTLTVDIDQKTASLQEKSFGDGMSVYPSDAASLPSDFAINNQSFFVSFKTFLCQELFELACALI